MIEVAFQGDSIFRTIANKTMYVGRESTNESVQIFSFDIYASVKTSYRLFLKYAKSRMILNTLLKTANTCLCNRKLPLNDINYIEVFPRVHSKVLFLFVAF